MVAIVEDEVVLVVEEVVIVADEEVSQEVVDEVSFYAWQRLSFVTRDCCDH